MTTVLLVEKKGEQSPIYFISHVLTRAEQRYELLEKALHKLDIIGRLLKWALELSVFDIEYHPCTTIKSQALADFIIETT